MHIPRELYPLVALGAIFLVSWIGLGYAFRKRRDRDPLVMEMWRIALGITLVIDLAYLLVHRFWHPLLSSRVALLVVIFLIYVAFIPLFGKVYFRLYRKRQANFTFTANIVDEAVKHAIEEAEQKLSEAKRALIILEEAVRTLEKGEERLDEFWAGLPSSDPRLPGELGKPLSFERSYVFWTADGSYAACLVHEELSHNFTRVFVGEQGKTFVSARFPTERRRKKKAFVELFEEVRLRKEKETERLLSSLASGHPDPWNYVDFLYFSTITQTTVGYGDILPNSRIVRIVVILQIIFGYFIVVAVVTGLTFFQLRPK